MSARFQLYFFISLLVCSTVLFSLLKGSGPLSADIFYQLRLPRTMTAFVCGGLLALSGSLMQLLVQNPLADPYVLGVSSGAALVSLLFMLFGIDQEWLFLGAWIGSLLTIVLIMLLARKHRFHSVSLLLAGVAIAFGFSACISLILLISPESNLHSMLFWLTGDLNDAAFPWIGLSTLLIGLLCCMALAPGLNIFARGEREARALGLSCDRYRIALYLLSSVFTASAVTLAGCVGFIGLIIPHLTRGLAGFDHRVVLPLSMLLGGSLLTFADTCARTLTAPQQLPVGILMALIGVPIFIWLLHSEQST